MNKPCKLSVLFLMALCSFIGSANERPILKLGYVQFKPYAYTVNGKLQGSIEQVLTKILDHAGIEYSAIELPNKRAKKYLEESMVDFTVVIKGFISNSDDYWISDQAIASIKLEAISIDKQIAITQFSDLKHHPLIVLTGYSYGGRKAILETDPDFNITASVENHSAGINALRAKRGKFLLAYHLPAKEAIKHHDTPFFHYGLDKIPMYIFLRKNLKNSEVLMNKINHAITQLSLQN